MNKYLIMPDRCAWFIYEAYSDNPEIIYTFVCSNYMPRTKIAIINCNNGAVAIYSQEIDKNGNWIKTIRHNPADCGR